MAYIERTWASRGCSAGGKVEDVGPWQGGYDGSPLAGTFSSLEMYIYVFFNFSSVFKDLILYYRHVPLKSNGTGIWR